LYRLFGLAQALFLLLTFICAYVKILYNKLKVGACVIILPRYEQAVIPARKFTDYALNPDKQPHKALVFEVALGYNLRNYQLLINNIKSNLRNFPAKQKENKGYGDVYEIVMELLGENGKTAKVLTGWIDDIKNGEMRLTSVYVVDRGRK
jgi:hypothetical protein